MLRELRIKNLAIIDDLRVKFKDGLNVLTGETGAGKSIIVDSLSLALGSRAQSDFIRSGEKEAFVQAYFDIDQDIPLPDIGLDISDGLILRRIISSSGKSRAYANDIMVSIQSLSEIGRALVDIHGQHEHQSLFSIERHRLFLDSFGKLEGDREQFEALYRDVETLRVEKSDLEQKMKERAQRSDLLKFQVNEIDMASLKLGEKEDLVEKKRILSQVEKLRELSESAYSMIYGSEGSCIERLSSIISCVKEMASIDSSVEEIHAMLESAQPLIEDAAVSLRKQKEKYETEPGELSAIEERLEFIKKLEKKYGEGIEQIIGYRNTAANELEEIELVDERLEIIETNLKAKEGMLFDSVALLSEKRKQAAKKMGALMKQQLKELAFSNAEFLAGIEQGPITPHGTDKVEFLFSANPGEQPKPLAKIASGGEISRVMLALKSIFADFDNIPVLIFDEVDAGIGGKTAESVGKKLKVLSGKHQVLCTTHLPQIASMGKVHLAIEKAQKNGRAYVEVKELSGQERLREIARMLSGKITDSSMKHAKELLELTV